MKDVIGPALMVAGVAEARIGRGAVPGMLEVGVKWPGQRRYTVLHMPEDQPLERWLGAASSCKPEPWVPPRSLFQRLFAPAG
jgi:hypothetical protein